MLSCMVSWPLIKKKKNEAKAEQYLFCCSAVCYTAQSDTNFLVRVKSQSVAIQ